MNEPLPVPENMSSLDRISFINKMREEQLNGVVHEPEQLRFMLSLLRLERQAATGRGSSRSNSAGSKQAPVALSLDDL